MGWRAGLRRAGRGHHRRSALALHLTDEIKELDERIGVLLARLDPNGIITSAPGVAQITGAQILGRLGNPNRFDSLAGVRSFSGLVPRHNASGVTGKHGPPTKAGDALLREALFMAANQARRIDPTLAARYHRLMVTEGKHHTSALCHIATVLLTRIVACWRRGERYVIRDLDGRTLTNDQAKAIIATRYTVPDTIRQARRTTNPDPGQRTSRCSQESQRAPAPGPSTSHATTPSPA